VPILDAYIDFLILGDVPNGKKKSVAIIPRFWFGKGVPNLNVYCVIERDNGKSLFIGLSNIRSSVGPRDNQELHIFCERR